MVTGLQRAPLPPRSRHVVLIARIASSVATSVTRWAFLSIRSSEAENSASGMQACTVVEHFCRLVTVKPCSAVGAGAAQQACVQAAAAVDVQGWVGALRLGDGIQQVGWHSLVGPAHAHAQAAQAGVARSPAQSSKGRLAGNCQAWCAADSPVQLQLLQLLRGGQGAQAEACSLGRECQAAQTPQVGTGWHRGVHR